MQSHDNTTENQVPEAPSWSSTNIFLLFLILDLILTIVLTTPIVPGLQDPESVSFKSWSKSPFEFYKTLNDLTILSVFRIITALLSLLLYYCQKEPPKPAFELYNPTTKEKKSKDELDEEAVEEPFDRWVTRYLSRHCIICQVTCFFTLILLIIKCLVRLNAEIGLYDKKIHHHPMWWTTLGVVACLTFGEMAKIESVGSMTGECARYHREKRRATVEVSSAPTEEMLQDPLLAYYEDIETPPKSTSPGTDNSKEDYVAASDIKADAQYKATFLDLLKLCLPDSHLLLVAFCFLLLAAWAQIFIPKFTGDILDSLTKTNDDVVNILDVPGFLTSIVKLTVAALLAGVFGGARGSIFTLVGGRVVVRLRILVMDALLTQEIGFYDKTKSGNLSSRLTSDTSIVGENITLYVNILSRSTVQAAGVLVYMFLISWQLTLIAFISVPVLTFLTEIFGGQLRIIKKVMQKKFADGNAISQASLESMTTVRAFGAEKSELKEYETYMDQYLALNIRQSRIYCLSNFCYYSLPQLVTAVVLYYGGMLVLSGAMTSGQLVTFMLYLSSLNDAFASIGFFCSNMAQSVGAADKVFELIHRKSEIRRPSPAAEASPAQNHTDNSSNDPYQQHLFQKSESHGISHLRVIHDFDGGIHPKECIGEVTLKNVDMFYPARPFKKVLDNMTLRAPPGAVVALVGPSGGGKSSVVSLIQHLYEPTSGRVCIDGIDVHELSPEWLCRNVSIVSQEPKLFGRSIRRNIIFGLEDTEFEPTLEEVKRAAVLSNAAGFIEKMPEGYETDVGERGVQLSGGQKQRIAIARALVRKPRILLLDEATSALDAESEALVQSALDDMLKRSREGKSATDRNSSMTVIVIAHRLSTIRSADLICVVEGGHIVEQGTHEELIANKENGTYAKLIERQLSSSLS